MVQAKQRKPKLRGNVVRLSREEIYALQTIFGNIGGDPDNSPRHIIDVLDNRFAQRFSVYRRFGSHGSMYFDNYNPNNPREEQ